MRGRAGQRKESQWYWKRKQKWRNENWSEVGGTWRDMWDDAWTHGHKQWISWPGTPVCLHPINSNLYVSSPMFLRLLLLVCLHTHAHTHIYTRIYTLECVSLLRTLSNQTHLDSCRLLQMDDQFFYVFFFFLRFHAFSLMRDYWYTVTVISQVHACG